jgi:hypothetical protein
MKSKQSKKEYVTTKATRHTKYEHINIIHLHINTHVNYWENL